MTNEESGAQFAAAQHLKTVELQAIAIKAKDDEIARLGIVVADQRATIAGMVAPAAPSLHAAAEEVLKHRHGALPTCGWLRDNDASRKALEGLACALAAPAAPSEQAEPQLAVPKGYKLVPIKITPEMIERAIEAHYGKRRVAQVGGAQGVSMTVNNTDWSGVEAMRNLWRGALSAAPAAPLPDQPEQIVPTDGLISVDAFYQDAAEDIAHALAHELEDAELSPNDFVTVNREKLLAIAKRVLVKAAAMSAPAPAAPLPELTGPSAAFEAARKAYVLLTNSGKPTDSGGAEYTASTEMMVAFDGLFELAASPSPAPAPTEPQQTLPLCNSALRAEPASQQDAGASGWQPIETAPRNGRTLLLGCFNSMGNWRTMRGQWFSAAAIAQDWEDPDDAEEGWYETAVEPDVPNCWSIAPTHWMPTPAAPEASPASRMGGITSKAKDAAVALWNATGEQLQSADDTLRALSSYVGQGGCWDTENLNYEEMAARIKEGIDVLVKVAGGGITSKASAESAAPGASQPMEILSDVEVMKLRDVGATWMSQDGRDALDDWLNGMQSSPVAGVSTEGGQ